MDSISGSYGKSQLPLRDPLLATLWNEVYTACLKWPTFKSGLVYLAS